MAETLRHPRVLAQQRNRGRTNDALCLPPASPNRVLLVLQSTAVGGMESHCVHLSAELIRRGVSVTAVLPEDREFDGLTARFCGVGAAVERLDTDGRQGRSRQIRRLPALLAVCRGWRPQVVHLHTGGATGGLAIVLAARYLARAAAVVTEHDVPIERPGGYQRFGKLLMDRWTTTLVAVSRRNAMLRLQRLGGPLARYAAVLNGVPTQMPNRDVRIAGRLRVRQELNIDNDAIVIGSLVRLAPGKGLDDLLQAFAKVLALVPCELLLVGDGPLRPELEAMAIALGVIGHVRFAGQQAEPGPYLDAMDLFALAVPQGSMSIALLEAMARALPVAITFCGPEEAVVPEVTGLAAPPRDPAALAATLHRLVVDPGLRARLGGAGAAHVQRQLSAERVADDLLELYSAAKGGAIPGRLSVRGGHGRGF